MTPLQEKVIPRYPRRNAAEDRAWSRLYRKAGKPALAAEVVRHLESDLEAKRFHLALYLRCCETLRRRAVRRECIDRIGRLVRWVLNASRPSALNRHDTLSGVGPNETPLQKLAAIERAAERAGVPQLRAYVARIDADRCALDGDDRAYADALLLKLDRLLREQQVEPKLVDPRTVVPFARPTAQRDVQRHGFDRSAA